MRFPVVKYLAVPFALCALVSGVHAVGQSAVITLVFPPGARATGLGEAFTGVADDANATFFNPAGLGQDPMSNSWKAYSMSTGDVLTAIASKRRKTFGMNEKIWAGTNHGVIRFNGKAWESYERHLIVQGDNLQSVAKKYLSIDNDALIRHAVMILMKANKIEAVRTGALQQYLRKEVTDSIQKAKNFSLDDLADDIMALSKSDRTAAEIYGKIATKVDSLKASSMADEIVKILSKKDLQFEDLVELKVPFRIAVDEGVTTMALDSIDRMWAGTQHGLWRYDGSVWNYFSEADGLPSNYVTAVCIGHSGTFFAGTDEGLAAYDDGKWTRISPPSGFPDSGVTAVACGKGDALYVGTHRGLAVRKDSAWTVVDTANGLLDPDVPGAVRRFERQAVGGRRERRFNIRRDCLAKVQIPRLHRFFNCGTAQRRHLDRHQQGRNFVPSGENAHGFAREYPPASARLESLSFQERAQRRRRSGGYDSGKRRVACHQTGC